MIVWIRKKKKKTLKNNGKVNEIYRIKREIPQSIDFIENFNFPSSFFFY